MINSFLLSHECNIYHLNTSNSEGSYGISPENMQTKSEYGAIPDLTDVECYGAEVNQSIVQGEPRNMIVHTWEFTFKPNVDIRKLDAIDFDGERYIAQKPVLIKNSHIEVVATRSEAL